LHLGVVEQAVEIRDVVFLDGAQADEPPLERGANSWGFRVNLVGHRVPSITPTFQRATALEDA
jgi:hypothetical protein